MSALWRNRAAKVTVAYIIMVVVVIFIAASALPGAINAWVGNGSDKIFTSNNGVAGNGTLNPTLNTLWTTVGGLIIVAVVLMAFLRARG